MCKGALPCYLNFKNNTGVTALLLAVLKALYQVSVIFQIRSGIVELYTLSYLWYTALGMMTTIFVGLIVSFLTGRPTYVSMNVYCINLYCM